MGNTPSGVSGQNAQQLVEEEPRHVIAPAPIPHLRMVGNPVLIKDLVQRLRPKAVMSNLVQVSYTVVDIFRAFSLTWHLAIYGTKESVYIQKEFNSPRVGLEHQHNHHNLRFIGLGHQYGRRDMPSFPESM